jgi:hypothetical protein
MTRVVTSGSAVTPEDFHSPSPKLYVSTEISSQVSRRRGLTHPLVFSITPIHLDSPNESATSRLDPIRLRRAASTRASAWCFSVRAITSPVSREHSKARVSLCRQLHIVACSAQRPYEKRGMVCEWTYPQWPMVRCSFLAAKYGWAGSSSECIRAIVPVEPERWDCSISVKTVLSAFHLSAKCFLLAIPLLRHEATAKPQTHLKERQRQPLFQRHPTPLLWR